MPERSESLISLQTNDSVLRDRLAAAFLLRGSLRLLSPTEPVALCDLLLLDGGVFEAVRHALPPRPVIVMLRPGAESLPLDGPRVAGTIGFPRNATEALAVADLCASLCAPASSWADLPGWGAEVVSEAQALYEDQNSYGENGPESLLPVAFDALPFFAALVDGEGYLLALNRAGRESVREYSQKPFWKWDLWASQAPAIELAFAEARRGRAATVQGSDLAMELTPLGGAGLREGAVLAVVRNPATREGDQVLRLLRLGRTARFEASPGGDFTPQRVSTNWEEVLGEGTSGPVALGALWEERLSAEDRSRLRAAVRNIFHTRTASLALRYRHPAGESLVLQAELRLLEEPGATAEPVLEGLLTDVTAQRRLEEQAARGARIEAGAALAMGVVNHLNNTMLSIMGHAELLRDDLALRPDQAAVLDRVASSAQRAGDLVRRLLTCLRGQRSGAADPTVSELLEALAAASADVLPPGTMLRTRIQPDLPALPGDPLAVAQLLLGLLRQAAEATPAGSELVLEGRLCEASPGGPPAVLVTMTHGGPAPTADAVERLLAPVALRGGSGRAAGLQPLVLSLRASLRVESPASGEGRTIRLELPV